MDNRPADAAEAAARHWRRTCGLTLQLLAVWLVVGFVVPWFARDLDFVFFGWPFSFWMAAQGGAIVFVVLLVVYARRMARLDRELADTVARIRQAGDGDGSGSVDGRDADRAR